MCDVFTWTFSVSTRQMLTALWGKPECVQAMIKVGVE